MPKRNIAKPFMAATEKEVAQQCLQRLKADYRKFRQKMVELQEISLRSLKFA